MICLGKSSLFIGRNVLFIVSHFIAKLLLWNKEIQILYFGIKTNVLHFGLPGYSWEGKIKKKRKRTALSDHCVPTALPEALAGCCLSGASRFHAKTFRGTRGHLLIQWNISIKWEVCQVEGLHINHRLTRIFICLTPLLLGRACLCLAHTVFYLFRKHNTDLQLEGTGWSDDTVKGMQDFLRVRIRDLQQWTLLMTKPLTEIRKRGWKATAGKYMLWADRSKKMEKISIKPDLRAEFCYNGISNS